MEVPVPGLELAEADRSGALTELESYSLITRAPDAPRFSVHRLVQEVTRRNQGDDAAHATLSEVLRWSQAAWQSPACFYKSIAVEIAGRLAFGNRSSLPMPPTGAGRKP